MLEECWILTTESSRKEVTLVRTIVTGLIFMIICLATYAVTAMQNHW
jgi:hypothetical protein